MPGTVCPVKLQEEGDGASQIPGKGGEVSV